jgi:hypothetical protein
MRWCDSCLTRQTLRRFCAESGEIYAQGRGEGAENEAITPDITCAALSVRSKRLFFLDLVECSEFDQIHSFADNGSKKR